MRVVTAFAVLALVALSTTCSAGGLLQRVPKVHKAHQKANGRAGGLLHRAPKPHYKAEPGRAYALVSEFMGALVRKNYTHAYSLLADDGVFIVTDLSCDVMNKTTLTAAISADAAGLGSSQAVLGDWLESNGTAIIKTKVGGINMASPTSVANYYYNPNAYLVGYPTEDGTQLAMFERITKPFRGQPNEEQMLNVWTTIKAADEIGDIKPWESLLTSNFTFEEHFAFDQYPEVDFNSTQLISVLSDQYKHQKLSKIEETSVFPVCSNVVAEIMAFKAFDDGRSSVRALFVSLYVTSDFKLADLDEWTLGYY